LATHHYRPIAKYGQAPQGKALALEVAAKAVCHKYLIRYNLCMNPNHFEKPLHWVGSSKKDLVALPSDVVDDFGYALGAVQMGATPAQAKPWKGEGPGVLELVENHED
jgi:hypothetical protein